VKLFLVGAVHENSCNWKDESSRRRNKGSLPQSLGSLM
jgi:hypothetical protein